MRKYLIAFVWLLVSLTGVSQSITALPDQLVFPGNPYVLNVVVSRADSAANSTATLFYSPNGRQIEQPGQPIVSRAGRLLSIAWTANQTRTLPVGQQLYLSISAGPVARLGALVTVTKYPQKITQPGTFTVVSPVVELSETGSTSQRHILNNVAPSGYRINHNKGTRLVTAIFLREVDGELVEDKLWGIKRPNDMQVEVTGPSSEVFPGQVLLFFPIQTISN